MRQARRLHPIRAGVPGADRFRIAESFGRAVRKVFHARRTARRLGAGGLAAAVLVGLTALPATAQAAELPAEGATITTVSGAQHTFTVQMEECGLMAYGTQGSCTASLQSMLRVFVDPTLPVTGFYGGHTAAATRLFQMRRGLDVDGQVGPETRAALVEAYIAAWRQAHPPHTGGYGYSLRYTVVHWASDPVPPETVLKYVRTHFGVAFPLQGNCPDILTVGTRCDLVGLGKGNVEITEIGSRHFALRSLPGHAEGPNRDINFGFSQEGNALYLDVTASGPVPDHLKPRPAQRANNVFVETLWEAFGRNVSNLLTYQVIK